MFQTILLIFADALFQTEAERASQGKILDADGAKAITRAKGVPLDYRLIASLRNHALKSLYRLQRFGYELVLVFQNESEKSQVLKPFKTLCLKEGIVFADFLTVETLMAERFFKNKHSEPVNILNRDGLNARIPYLQVCGLTSIGDLQHRAENLQEDSETHPNLVSFKTSPACYQFIDATVVAAAHTEDAHGPSTLAMADVEVVEGSWLDLCERLLARDRVVRLVRDTLETTITVELNLDGSGSSKIDTGLHFFNHMLENFTKHAGFDLRITSKGDLHIDEHHTIEDTALTLGEALKRALGGKQGINRYAFSLPMDESRVTCLLDLSGRSYVVWEDQLRRERVGDFPTELARHFYESLATAGGFNLHLTLAGTNDHHQIEASFKALARCFREAVRRQGEDVPSTKGGLS